MKKLELSPEPHLQKKLYSTLINTSNCLLHHWEENFFLYYFLANTYQVDHPPGYPPQFHSQ